LDPFQARHFELAARLAADAGVRLLFLELPSSPQLEEAMPDGTVQGFRDFVTTVARRHGFRFVTLEDLRLDLDAADFRDGTHLGYRGATKVTAAAAPFVAAELKKRADAPAPRAGFALRSHEGYSAGSFCFGAEELPHELRSLASWAGWVGGGMAVGAARRLHGDGAPVRSAER
jgi:hypothetical protein